jgi:hypothetical protein
VLGLALIVCAASGLLDGSDFPRPVGTVLLVIVGVGLLVLGVVIWLRWIAVKLLAYGNGVAAVAGFLWLVGVSGWSPAGAVTVALTVGALAALASVQAATLRP